MNIIRTRKSKQSSKGDCEGKEKNLPVCSQHNLTSSVKDPPSLSHILSDAIVDAVDTKAQGTEVHRAPVLEDPEYSLSSLTLLKGMLLNVYGTKPFRFRMSRTASLATSGAGAMALATLIYPSQFDQFSAIGAIFQEARLHSARIQYTLLATLSGISNACFVTAYNPSAETGYTITTSAVTRLPNCKLFSTANTNWPVRLVAKLPRNRPWSNIAASSTGFDPFGGTVGAFCHVIMNTASNSTSYLQYLIEAEYDVRSMY
jgi:hypothetical protein